LTDTKNDDTQPWFGYDVDKIVSTSAALTSILFNSSMSCFGLFSDETFDSRAFSLPESEVCNYFVWRQNDAIRNAINQAGREYFSHQEILNMSTSKVIDILRKSAGVDFESFSSVRKRGFTVTKKVINLDIPLFKDERGYVERFLKTEKESQ
jgi:tRNA(His) 5'-end guanylyltransferase